VPALEGKRESEWSIVGGAEGKGEESVQWCSPGEGRPVGCGATDKRPS
jgi:hypothetical protein